MAAELVSRTHSLLTKLRGIDPLKQLFWQELNYHKVNQPLPRRDWSQDAAQALASDPLLFAQADGFHIVYCQLSSEKLRLTEERLVINRLLRDHPYSLFVFSDQSRERWHFVNVREGGETRETGSRKVRRLLRRIAVGPEERLRTASERIAKLDLASIAPGLFGISPLEVQRRHDEAFDVEAVTDKFFSEYRDVFSLLQTDLARQVKNDKQWAHDYALQFLNRLMFLYFIQRKRWLGDDTEFIRAFWEAYKNGRHQKDSFFSNWLTVLFFEAFNNKFQAGRSDRRHFPPEIQNALAGAPFLNGGLFTENRLDDKYSFFVPESFFEMLFERFEKDTPGFLERYNFTIREDSPFDQEVAVDPEMIGKVYESLVNITFEGVEEEDRRGTAGIFYTPRIEIDLMCRLSLVDWLANHLGPERKPVLYDAVFAYEPQEKQAADEALVRENLWGELHRLLSEVTVLDPACGSGSFLVGMLNVLDDLQERANTVLGKEETPYERRKRIIGQSLYGVDVMEWAVHVAELRLWLQLVVETEIHPAELRFRPLLPNLSFKVRPGDSLVQEIGGINFALHRTHLEIPRELKGPLAQLKDEKLRFYANDPQAKFKTEAALHNEEMRLFRGILDAKLISLQQQIQRLKHQLSQKQTDLYGNESSVLDAKSRKSVRREVDRLEAELSQLKQARQALKPGQPVPFVWDISFVEIFEGEKQGFDIVLGNPPYVRFQQIGPPNVRPEDCGGEGSVHWKKAKEEYKAQLQRSVASAYPVFFGYKPQTGEQKRRLDGKSDLYIYFYLHGQRLLNPRGSFCFITSNSWLDVDYGRELQEFLLRQGHARMLLDNQARRTFAQADINTVIALLGAPDERPAVGTTKDSRFVMFKVPFENVLSSVIFVEIESVDGVLVRPEFRAVVKSQVELYEQGLALPEDDQRQTINGGRYEGDKWGGKYLRAPDIVYRLFEPKDSTALVPLAKLAEVGTYLILPRKADKVIVIEKQDVPSNLAGWFKPFVRSTRYFESPLMRESGHYVLVCNEDSVLRDRNLRRFIENAETKLTELGGEPANGWFVVTQEPGRLLWPRRHADRHVVLYNPHSFFSYDLYRLAPRVAGEEYEKALLGVLLSTPTALLKELYGRANLGQGALKTEGTDIQKLPVFDFETHKATRRLALLADSIMRRPILPLREEITQRDRLALDGIILDALGFTEEDRRTFYEAAVGMVEKRLAKAKSLEL